MLANGNLPQRRVAVAFTILTGLIAVGVGSYAAAQSPLRQLLEPAITDIDERQYADVNHAIDLFRRGQLDEAKDAFVASKEKHPELPPGEILFAQLLVATNQGAAARNAFELAAKNHPQDPEAYVAFGEIALNQNQVTDGEALMEKGLALAEAFKGNPKRKRNLTLRSLAGLATVYERREDFATALKYLERWVKMDPDNAAPYARLARAQFELEDVKEAYLTLNKQHEVDENAPRAEVSMALLYEQESREQGKQELRQNAAKLMKLAVDRDPKDLQVRLAAAEWAAEADELAFARENAQEALKIDGDSLQAMLLLGLVARYQGDLTTAEKMFSQALLKSPGNFGALNNMAITLVATDDNEKRQRALELAELLARANSDRNQQLGREAAITFAWCLLAMGREVEANRVVQAALSAGSVSRESGYYTARVLAEVKRYEDAIKVLGPMMDVSQDYPMKDLAKALYDKILAENPSLKPKDRR